MCQRVIFICSAAFGSHFCHHRNGKRQINTRPLHLDFWSNKAITNILLQSNFFGLLGGGGMVCSFVYSIFIVENLLTITAVGGSFLFHQFFLSACV